MVQSNNKQELMKQQQNKINSIGFSQFMSAEAVKRRVNNVLGGERGRKFIASIVSAVTNNSALQECTNDSIFNAALLGESLNLPPSPQLAMFYIVPFNDKEKGKVAQFQLGWKGYYQLALRSGYYKKLNVIEIKEDEFVSWNPLEEELVVNLIEDEEVREKAQTVGYYAFYEYANGFKKAIYWNKGKMESHARKYSQGYRKDLKDGTKYTFWSKDFDSMAKKTMLRQLISKYGIMSTELQNAYESDMAVITENGKDYVDNQKDETPEPQAKIIEAKEVNIDEL